MSNGHLALRLDDVAASYADGLVLRGVSLSVHPGEMVGILGPNGSGKTTLLRVASGVLKPLGGEVEVFGRPVQSLARREMARRVAVVPQEVYVPFALTVTDIVLMGRTPHAAGKARRDQVAVTTAMEATGTLPFAERVFNELSGGEKQRVLLAMALAQEPELLLLDEPTVHLDISHQMEIMELVRRLNRERGLTVMATMHDLNLAALFFDRLVLLDEGVSAVDGRPGEVLSEQHILRVFGAAVQIQAHPTADAPQIVLLPR